MKQLTFDNLNEKSALDENKTFWDKMDKEFEEHESKRKQELQEFLNQRPAIRQELNKLVLEFIENYGVGLMFYSYVQSNLKANFGKKYPIQYFEYMTEELRKRGITFIME